MKNTIVILLMFVLAFAVGCQPEKPLSEIRKECDEIFKNTLGDDWKENANKELIELNVDAGSTGSSFRFDISVKNDSNNTIYVCSSDFTLQTPSGITVNPRSDSVHSFEAIRLNQGEKMRGYIYFESSSVGESGIYYLNFNHHLGSQRFPFKK